jgi:hypothetical protein
MTRLRVVVGAKSQTKQLAHVLWVINLRDFAIDDQLGELLHITD